ncbi:hypothetical protein L6452_37347 [Arctium lappa]|uniref:Uncharacterized protein n=1 Tax=Arctium lappa TaxID=4217 RepID=A0ACB8Y375_ARCLA|nr:hypothetical protein L6452_37347 [Arctium lappa]
MLSSLDIPTLPITPNLPILPTVDLASSFLYVMDVVFTRFDGDGVEASRWWLWLFEFYFTNMVTGVEGEERAPEVMTLHGAAVALRSWWWIYEGIVNGVGLHTNDKAFYDKENGSREKVEE